MSGGASNGACGGAAAVAREAWTSANFHKQYGNYCSLLGERVKLVLPLAEGQVELTLLWRLVITLGGAESVSRLQLWPAVTEQLLPGPTGNAATVEAVRSMYYERLSGFELYVTSGKLPVPAGRLLRTDGSASPSPQLPSGPLPAGRPLPQAVPMFRPNLERSASGSQAQQPQPQQPAQPQQQPAWNPQAQRASTTRRSSRRSAPKAAEPLPAASVAGRATLAGRQHAVKEGSVVPEVPAWAMQPGVFFPIAKPSSRDPRQRPPKQEPAAPAQPADAQPAPRNGGVPWDPLASFSQTPLLKARISAALAQRSATLAAGETKADAKPVLDFVPVSKPPQRSAVKRPRASSGSGFVPLTAPVAPQPRLASLLVGAAMRRVEPAAPVARKRAKLAEGGEAHAAEPAPVSKARQGLAQADRRRHPSPRRGPAAAPSAKRHKAHRSHSRRVSRMLAPPQPPPGPIMPEHLQAVEAADVLRRLRGTAAAATKLAEAPSAGPAEPGTAEPQPEGLPGVLLEAAHLEWLALLQSVRSASARAASHPSPRRSLQPANVRRSSRMRSRPAAYVPGSGDDEPRRGSSEESSEEEPEPGVREGPGFQAELPEMRPLPAAPSAEEAAWLEDRVLEPGAFGPADAPVPLVTHCNASGERWYAHAGSQQRLTPEQAEALGLHRMGMANAVGWSEAEVAAFERGIDEDGRDFAEIATRLLPDKGPIRVASFYYNVWKTRAHKRAAAWYRRRQEERDRKERQRRELEAARQQQVAAQLARRQLREGLAWLKGLARQPLLPQNTKVRADRMGRAIRALAKANLGRQSRAE